MAVAMALSVTAAVLGPAQPSKGGTEPPVEREEPADVLDLPAPAGEQGEVRRLPDAGVAPAGIAPVGRVEPAVNGPVAGIPATLHTAYQKAALRLAQSQPECRLPATLLAAIGKVESDHARGGRVDATGRTLSPIIGLRLDGSPGLAAIRDTDGGAYDGDVTWDRAVGPMQFIPGTWRRWASDGNGDGKSDPHNVHDATVAAGRYLCANGRDLSTAAGLRSGVLSYNHSEHYLNTVRQWMELYRKGVSAMPDTTAAAEEVVAAPEPVKPAPDVIALPTPVPPPPVTLPPAPQLPADPPPAAEVPAPGPATPVRSPDAALAQLVEGTLGTTVCVVNGVVVHVTEQATGLLGGLLGLPLLPAGPADREQCLPPR
ncbi:Transglycosylase SLT domain-containing protein [Lentzea fradiae]|uniref:Transglycosylase SLT domain-containing protein n=2 Tax=Lentzea fradiae TaxID=200378 RepID=A0A1G7L794_9PSEU|nr:Transglycosylase SLT domain-containing protein [Lentzea fradiae]